ncbi:NAD-dependent succinate-semialdehyde dehydrogenase [Stappia stellulata]|uniref:NAD-dependent succinate-semialdehyde dehydrogenase n=1 Tax=Stappia stellulata TaxID=71235 RepID=UPI0003FCB1B9|nr:NAD-dependent succinate-semialdehyde dehydrogenase [Stappia stellulata]
MSNAAAVRERLSDPGLLETRALIGGEWVETERCFDVVNPASGETIARVPDLGAADFERAISAAEAARGAWAAQSAEERSIVLRRLHDLMVAHADDLAMILTLEMGKPLAEAKGEVLYGASYVEWFAEEAKRIQGDIMPGHGRDKRILVIRQPVGTVAAITPWNFPNAMLARKLAPALAAGCSLVAKPDARTPLSALALAALAEKAGVPKGLLSVLTTRDADMAGRVLCGSKAVRKISFTGSTDVGRLLMRQSADTLKKLSLELGGNAPFIVFDDADLERAVEGAIAAKYRNAGQTCVCVNRFIVEDGIHDAFAGRLAEETAKLAVGDGLRAGTRIGPLIDEAALKKVEGQLSDALAKGARLLTGGSRAPDRPSCMLPTVLSHVTPDMLVARQETFGPVAQIFRFKGEEEALALANDTEYGLASYFYTRDLNRTIRISEGLEFGMVGINTGQISTAMAPFGGIKQAGMGREGSRYGIEDYLEMKYLCLDTGAA